MITITIKMPTDEAIVNEELRETLQELADKFVPTKDIIAKLKELAG